MITTFSCRIWTMELKDRLQYALDRKGWSQTDLGNALGLTPQAIQKWLNGGGIRQNRLKEVAEVLGVSYQWLFTGTGIMVDGVTIEGVKTDIYKEISDMSVTELLDVLDTARSINSR